MESTKLLEAIKELREQYNEPPSHLNVIRDSVLAQLARKNRIDMPPILDEKQRNIFMSKIDLLEGFLKSENGADAVELLINAFQHYCEQQEQQD